MDGGDVTAPDRAREIAERYAKHCVAYARDPSVLDSETRVDATAEAMAQALYEYAAPIERERDEAARLFNTTAAIMAVAVDRANRFEAKLSRVEAVCEGIKRAASQMPQGLPVRIAMECDVRDVLLALTGDERKDPTDDR